ncbi:hypothetical protein OHA70_05775 [Kribbella sp. NBC_00382]|uniref:hypothetical protein n=1 Tax=Kribbella sp. NBC_00382 TaxID=2975967 RepID=UPI002E1ACB76
MQNDPEIGAELDRLANGDPLAPVDVTGLLQRGRRGRRRRRIASASGLAAGVAVIAVGAALVPDIGAAQREPAAAGAGAALFTPMPGVPQGEAALGKITRAEAERRCTIRYGVQPLATFHPSVYRATMGLMSRVPGKKNMFGPGCVVPGDSKPTAAALAKVKADPAPRTADGQLLSCSVLLWHDLTKWRVVSTEQGATDLGRVLRMLAVSPTGRSAASCDLPLSGQAMPLMKSSTPSIRTAQNEPLMSLSGVGVYEGSGQIGCKSNCTGWTYTNFGRVDPAITRIHFKAVNGATHDLTVANGWYALWWANGDPKSRRAATVTAYNASGRPLKTVKIPEFKLK